MGDSPYQAANSTLLSLGGTFPPPGGFPPRSYGGSQYQRQQFSFLLSGSTVNHWRSYNFSGILTLAVPSIIHSPSPFCTPYGGSPHVPASVASTLASAAPPLHPLTHEDLSACILASDLTKSFWPPFLGAAAPSKILPDFKPLFLSLSLQPLLSTFHQWGTGFFRPRLWFCFSAWLSLSSFHPSQTPNPTSISPASSNIISHYRFSQLLLPCLALHRPSFPLWFLLYGALCFLRTFAPF
jgi:hypothetical protein